MSFDVECTVQHAFEVWTSKMGTWWPWDHTVTGRRDIAITLEPRIGGRIVERTPEGREYEWGAITAWEPPSRLAYLWYLGRDSGDATEVEIRFVPRSKRSTRIEIEHRGWESLAAPWRDRTFAGWQSLMPHFISAAEKGVVP
jgi:hypothetical protein